MDGGQRTAYARGLARRAASECASRGSEIAGNTVEYRRSRRQRRRPAGRGQAVEGQGPDVLWRARKGSGGALKAVDMTVDGRSLATSARRDAKAVLKRTDGDLGR